MRDALVAQLPGLRRYARTLCGDATRADDLVQDCIARALERDHLWQGGNLRAWLFTILHNLHVNAVRAGRARPVHDALVEAAQSAAPPDQHERLAAREVLARLADLPDDQRAALMLVAVEGLSYEEVAAVQGVPVGTVMSRLSRARARLRADSGEPPGLRRVK